MRHLLVAVALGDVIDVGVGQFDRTRICIGAGELVGAVDTAALSRLTADICAVIPKWTGLTTRIESTTRSRISAMHRNNSIRYCSGPLHKYSFRLNYRCVIELYNKVKNMPVGFYRNGATERSVLDAAPE